MQRSISLLPAFSKVMERLVLTRVKWSDQPINPYSLGFGSGVVTSDALATLIYTAAPMTALRRGYKSRLATLFLDLEKDFELVSKEVLLESAALLGIRGQVLMWLEGYLTSQTGIVQFQRKKSKVNHLINGTPQASNLSPTLFSMVINQILQLNLGSKVQMIAYADDLAIHGGPIGCDILYKQMTMALNKIETKAMQLGLKFSPDKCEAIWYRSNNPDWNFKIAGEEIPWGASVKYLGIIIDKRQHFKKQGMRFILGVPRTTNVNMMRHDLHMLPVEHRANLSRAKLYRKIRGNPKHPLHDTINKRQRNGWTTEIQQCHQLASR